jgi:hypothetical protein
MLENFCVIMNVVCPTKTKTFYNIFIVVTLKIKYMRTVKLETINWKTLQDLQFVSKYIIVDCCSV